MKRLKHLFLILFLGLWVHANSQIVDRLFIETNHFRIAKGQSLFPFLRSHHPYLATFLNGGSLGYEVNPKLSFSLGVRAVAAVNGFRIANYRTEHTKINGHEINLRMGHSTNRTKRFAVGFDLEIF